eukprot:1530756-Rhodomonas_salina.2
MARTHPAGISVLDRMVLFRASEYRSTPLASRICGTWYPSALSAPTCAAGHGRLCVREKTDSVVGEHLVPPRARSRSDKRERVGREAIRGAQRTVISPTSWNSPRPFPFSAPHTYRPHAPHHTFTSDIAAWIMFADYSTEVHLNPVKHSVAMTGGPHVAHENLSALVERNFLAVEVRDVSEAWEGGDHNAHELRRTPST